MIRGLRSVLGPEHQKEFSAFLVWAVVYGIGQGVAIFLLVPIARSLGAGDLSATWRWVGILALVALATAVAHYVQAMKSFQVALVLLRTMHHNIGDHLVTLPLGWFSGQTGSVAQIAAKGTLSVAQTAAHLMTPLITAIAGPVTITVCLVAFDWRLGLALLLAWPVIVLVNRYSTGLIARGTSAMHETSDEASARVIEFARCQPVLRAFGRTGDTGYQPLEDAITAQEKAVRRNLVDSVVGLGLNGLAVQAFFTLLVVLAAVLALGGSISGWELLALLGIIARFVQPLNDLAEFGGVVRMSRADIERIERIMNTEPLPEPVAPVSATRRGEIVLDRVGFGYEPGARVLDDVSFEVEPGTMTAMVGPSGSGKTTVSRLVARFFDVDSGVVRVGGVDVRDQRAEELQAQLAMVFQDVYLFDDTLEQNIRIGNRAATTADLERAAELAGVTEIVERLPDGWQTQVGEAGSALSGGERQRVSIARALIKDAPIVLLDEASAALDPENQRYFQASLASLRGRSTLFVIAHRLATVVAADQILVLDEHGRIAERGTHDDLLALDGRYAAFWAERSRAVGWRLLDSGRKAV